MGRRERPIIVVVAVAAAVVLSACDPPQPWSSRLVTLNADGTDAANDISDRPVISPDGTKVAFNSRANDFGPTDTNGLHDVYVRDLTTGTTELVSVNADGTDSGEYQSMHPVFSPDGTKIAFNSAANDLVAGDVGDWDAFVRDLTTGVTRRMSVDATGEGLGGDASAPVFSPDGTKIALSVATRVAGDIYVRDLITGDLTLVTAVASGAGGGNDGSHNPVFSPDSSKVAFRSGASNLGPVDTNGLHDVYVRDLAAGTTTLVSANAGGTDSGNGNSSSQVFSPDGSKVAFDTHASNLGPTDSNDARDVYVRDLAAQTTTLVSTNANGTDSGNRSSGGYGTPAFHPDGTGVVFDSVASDLGPTDTNGQVDAYYRDFVTQTISLVSINAEGTDSGNGSTRPADPGFGPVGDRVVLLSAADDLGPKDTNGTYDLYAHDLATRTTTLISTGADGITAANRGSDAGSSSVAQFSDDGRHVAFRTNASDLGSTDTNGIADIYVATLHSADLSVEVSAEPEPVPAGSTLTYRLHIDNAGPDQADQATAALLLPGGTSVTSVASSAGDCAQATPEHPRLIVCGLDEVPLGDVADVTVTADVTAPTGTTLTAIAAVSSPTVDEDNSDNGTTVESTVD